MVMVVVTVMVMIFGPQYLIMVCLHSINSINSPDPKRTPTPTPAHVSASPRSAQIHAVLVNSPYTNVITVDITLEDGQASRISAQRSRVFRSTCWIPDQADYSCSFTRVLLGWEFLYYGRRQILPPKMRFPYLDYFLQALALACHLSIERGDVVSFGGRRDDWKGFPNILTITMVSL